MIEGSGLRGRRDRVDAPRGSVRSGESATGRGMQLEIRIPAARVATGPPMLALRPAANG